jgi:tetratricopeptide (TPR) repeat protein
LGRAHCREALGQVNEALDAFNRFATGYPDHYLTPLAVFGKARCLEQLAKFPEAKVVYEDFIAGQPEESPWRSRAEAALLYLDKDARAAKNAPDAAAAPLQAPVVFNPAPTAPISDPESAPPAR